MVITPPKMSNRWAIFCSVLSILLVCLCLFSLSLVSSSHDMQDMVGESRIAKVRQLTEIQNLMTQNQLTIARATLTTNPDELRQHTEAVERNIVAIRQVWAVFQASPMAPGERQLADTFDKHRTRWEREGMAPAVAALRANRPQEVLRLVQDRLQPLGAPMNDSMDALMRAQITARAQAEALERSSLPSWVPQTTLPGGLLLSALLGLLIIQERAHAHQREQAERDQLTHTLSAMTTQLSTLSAKVRKDLETMTSASSSLPTPSAFIQRRQSPP